MVEKKDSKTATKAEPKKPVTPREDPVVRAKRLLAEAEAKQQAKAIKQLDNARGELERATNQVARWTQLQERAAAKVRTLEEQAGITPANDAVSIADALQPGSNVVDGEAEEA